MEDSLLRLWDSTTALHRRFGVEFDPAVTRRLVVEEVKEFLDAMADVQLDNTVDNRVHLAEEFVDCVVVMLASLCSVDSIPFMLPAVDAVIEKNYHKTTKTHAVDPVTGKITRRR